MRLYRQCKVLPLPDNFLHITIDVDSISTNTDHTTGVQPLMDEIGNYPIYDPIIKHFVLSLKSNDFMFNDESFTLRIGTSMGRNWAPHQGTL